MKQWRWAVAIALVAQCVPSMAQTTVYESKDKTGPVYSDKPSAGASVANLPSANLIQVPTIVPPAPPLLATAPPSYRLLTIVSLANEATVHTNTGAFEFSARVVPALRAGDRIRIRLDGRPLPSTFRSTTLRIGESDWKAAASDDGAAHTLQLAIIDTQGTLLIESAPVRFYVQRATVAKERR
jgi:hypothetical protein